MATTYNNIYLDARRALKAAGADAPLLEAQELLRFAAGKTKEELYRDMPLYPSVDVEDRFRALLDRRLKGEPTAYLIGEWEFHGLPLDISPDVLIPRDDTEVLARQAILRARSVQGEVRVLDLCAGSGCVGLAIAHDCPGANVILGDLSEAALRVSRQNIRRNGLTNRVSTSPLNALEKPPSALWDFDVIACNPPYIPTDDLDGLDPSVRDYEPRMALDGGPDGLEFYRAVTTKWLSALRLGGWLLCEVGVGQAPQVELLFAQAGLQDIHTYPDSAGIWRVVEGKVDE